MDFSRLDYFIRAAELLNFTQAANECGITQTAMSQHISNMENTLGFKLFNRTTRSVSLTPAGEDFYIQAKQLLSDYQKAVQHSADIASGKISTLKILVPSVIDGSVVMPRFQTFQAQFPDVKLEIGIQSTREIADALNKGLCDIAISWPYEFDRSTTISYTIAEFQLDVLCSNKHRFVEKTKLTFADISNEKLYTVDMTQMPRARFNIERMWADLGETLPDLAIKQNVASIEEIILRMDLDPDIIVLVPSYCKNFLPDLYCALPLEEPLKFQLSVATQRNNVRPEVMRLVKTLADPRVPLNC